MGYLLHPNLADHPVTGFQHWPPCRPLVAAAAAELARYTGQHLITPQTILARRYAEEIFAGLRAAGLAVAHVVLDAAEDVLRRRIHGAAEAQPWRLEHLAGYRTARAWMIPAADLVIDTTPGPTRGRTPDPGRTGWPGRTLSLLTRATSGN